MKNKKVFYILVAILTGVFIGKFIYNGYENEVTTAFAENKKEEIYLIQYGVYSSNELMLENTSKIKDYFYYIENDKYHVLIGITKNKELKMKILKSYGLNDDVYMKKITTDNKEFIELLNQYDILVKNSNNKSTILTAEKQILSKYEELILRSE